jgi:hypothetical protein
MHDFILTEAQLGTRVAHAQDSEDCGWSALLDLSYAEYVRVHEAQAETDLTLDLETQQEPWL